ncbi:HNH/ENDO VII family nuclease [Pseudomonas putida]|uniref:HNH/ENDO VII family nuclease n=1 Tax=Pseudomonas putida TaxID=303 RepID=UPI00351E69C2
MENGLAPYGTDGKKINSHHMLQIQDGPIAEVIQNFHQKNVAVIHINSGPYIPSGINRAQLSHLWTRFRTNSVQKQLLTGYGRALSRLAQLSAIQHSSDEPR